MKRSGDAPSWDQLEVFLCIGRSATLAQAAHALGVTPSAVSQRLSALERQLNSALTYRSRHGVHLTEAGARMLKHCEEMATSAGWARESVRGTGEVAGLLRITCPQGLIDSILIPALASYLEVHPNLRYDILAVDEPVNLREQRVDLALRFGWVRDGNFIAKRLAAFEEIICASPGYLRRAGTPETPKDLLGHQWVGYSGFGTRQTLVFRTPAGGTAPVQVVPRISTSNAGSIVDWLVSGAGISQQPLPVVASAIEAGTLVRILEGYSLPGPTLYAVYLKGSSAPRVRPIVGHLAGRIPKSWGSKLGAQ